MTDRERVTKPAKKAAKKADGEAAVLAKIAGMPAPYRAMGERLQALILRSAPALQPTLYYGMPWCAKDGKRVCFFRADKYMTFGLTEEANLTREEGALVSLNERLRDDYIADCQRGVNRWNEIIKSHGIDFTLTLPHRGFRRAIGAFARCAASTSRTMPA